MLGESDTGSLLFPPLLYYFTDQIHICICLYCLSFFYNFPLQMILEEEDDKARPRTKEDEDVDVLHSWMKVGGHPAHPEEEAKGLLAEVNAFLCLFPISPSSLYFSFAYLLPILPSQS